MARIPARIRIDENGKGILEYKLEFYKSLPIIPAEFILSNDLNGIDCEVEGDDKKIYDIFVNRHPLAKRTASKGKIKQIPTASNSIGERKLPNYLTQRLDEHNPDNFNLHVNKAARYIQSEKRYHYYYKKKQGRENRLLDMSDFNFRGKFNKAMLQGISARQEKLYPSNTNSFAMSIDNRLIVGLGAASVYETSMTLHHIYGIPYIPGSALKGVARAFAIQKLTELLPEEKTAFKASLDQVFGAQEEKTKKGNKGRIIFYDAYPAQKFEIQPDIMNPHYSQYYSGDGTPPADYLNPIPITFLTVQKTHFVFKIGIVPNRRGGQSNAKDLLNHASDWLKAALKEHGIGAKTSVGYGYFEEAKIET